MSGRLAAARLDVRMAAWRHGRAWAAGDRRACRRWARSYREAWRRLRAAEGEG